MAEKTGLERFNEILREIGSRLFDGLKGAMDGKQWRHAVVDVRRDPDAPTMNSKLRIVMPDGSTTALLNTSLENVPSEVLTLFYELWDTKPELSPDQWYGVKLLIKPDGKCEVEFNYDPECALDESFFES